MLDSQFKYDFPKDHPEPFDESFDGNYYVSANGFSNLSDNLKDFSLNECGKHIPMGYKTLLICQRIALIRNGKIIKTWQTPTDLKINNDPFKGKYLLQTNIKNVFFATDWNRNIESNTIPKPSAKDGGLQSMLWDNQATCINHGLEKSSQNQSDCLISVLLQSETWH